VPVTTFRTLVSATAAALALAGGGGCSGGSAEGEAHKVKDLKSRGLKDPAKEDLKPAKGEAPGSKRGDPTPGK